MSIPGDGPVPAPAHVPSLNSLDETEVSHEVAGWCDPGDEPGSRRSKSRSQGIPLIRQLLLALLLVISLGIPARSQSTHRSLVGKWYGMKEGSPMTAEF